MSKIHERSKSEIREDLKEDVEDFLANGGKITVIENKKKEPKLKVKMKETRPGQKKGSYNLGYRTSHWG